ncbi:MAG: hypothetical protein R3192_17295 [Woeseiaceae bacterium]|nr:hypothetical protein [Woeseiaceae bacterium]
MSKLRQVGIWIDRRRAVIVSLDADEARVKTIKSGLAPRVRMAGGSRTKSIFGPQDVASESRRDRKHESALGAYYERVVSSLGDADAILILGPGESKRGLLDQIQASHRYRKTSTHMVTTDKLTEPQIVAHVKSHFGRSLRR